MVNIDDDIAGDIVSVSKDKEEKKSNLLIVTFGGKNVKRSKLNRNHRKRST